MRLGRSSSCAVSIGRGDRGEVVAVLDPLGVPAVCVEAPGDVLRPRHRRRPVELDAVVVVEVDELAEPEVAGERRRLGGDALLQVAVGDDPVDAVVDQRMVGAVELGREAAFGDRHADPVGEALAERTGRRLDAGRQAVFGMAGRARAPLAERLQVLEGDAVAGQVEERVQEHAGVPGGQDEPVAVRPVGMRRGVAQEPRPHDVRHRCGAHGGTGVTGVRLLDTVDRQGPDRVDGEAVEVGGDGHGMGSGAGRIRSCGDGCIVLPPRPCRATPSVKVVSKRLQRHGLSSGRACPAAAPPSPPLSPRPRESSWSAT